MIRWNGVKYTPLSNAQVADVADKTGRIHRIYVGRARKGAREFKIKVDGLLVRGGLTGMDVAKEQAELDFRQKYGVQDET